MTSPFLHEFLRTFAMRIANEQQCGAQPPRVFYVGGTVRDMVLGKEEEGDVDVEVYGVTPGRVQDILEELSGRPLDVFGAVFGVYKLSFIDGVLDVALPRAESKKGKGHRGFVITGDPHLSFIDALRRRDFTVNAMLRDVLTGGIIDPYGGQDDVVRGVLRVVDERTFPEDPLRVFRAMQFVARFAFRVDEQSMRLFQRMVHSSEIDTLSLERVTAEWKKMLLAAHPAQGLRFLEHSQLLVRYPELDALRNIAQDPNWHPEGSVWEHVVRCWEVKIDVVDKEGWDQHTRIAYYLALLLHDAGKAQVSRLRGKKVIDTGHAQASVEIAKEFFTQFTFSETVVHDVLACIAFHEDFPEIYRRARYEDWPEQKVANALRMLWRDVGVERVPLFLAVCEANARGRDLSLDDRPYPMGIWAKELSQRHGLYESASRPLLRGEDVQNIAARLSVPLPQGKAFGALLARVEAARDRGEIATRSEAIAYMEMMLGSEK